MNTRPIPNALFHAHYFGSVVIPTFRYLRAALLEKVLPGFEKVAEEAESVADEEFRKLGQLPAWDGNDMGDLAEQAHEAGLAYYEGMTAAKQAILNVLAAALYHLHEQQLLQFYRRELLGHSHGQATDPQLLKIGKVVQSLREHGIDCVNGFPSWAVVDELRLVANTVKHGYGDSSEALQARRPEMFVSFLIRDHVKYRVRSSAGVYAPLAGEDFYVTVEDLDKYFAVVLDFWQWLTGQLRNQAAA